MTGADRPAVSVVVACYRAERTIVDCLDSLCRQVTGHRFEVIVVNSSPDATPALIHRHFPHVRCLECPERKFAGEARNDGIALARGDIVAMTDADCVVAPDWIDAIVVAHDLPHPAIGGAIANGNPGSAVGWAGYLLELHQWMPSRPAGWMDDVGGGNMSYKREVFSRFGPFITGTYGSDTEFHWRLAAAGHRVWFEPSIRVAHRNIERLGRLLAHEFEHGRSFGRVRTGGQRLSRTRRVAMAGAFPLIAALLAARTVRDAVADRESRRALWRVAPLLAVAHLAWSGGEAAGYLSRRRAVSP